MEKHVISVLLIAIQNPISTCHSSLFALGPVGINTKFISWITSGNNYRLAIFSSLVEWFNSVYKLNLLPHFSSCCFWCLDTTVNFSKTKIDSLYSFRNWKEQQLSRTLLTAFTERLTIIEKNSNILGFGKPQQMALLAYTIVLTHQYFNIGTQSQLFKSTLYEN